ncbi:MAG: hypothetical protein AB7E72_01630 [Lysobacterales bacterium]
MVTKAQYEALLAQRATPKATLELTPDGPVFGQLRADLEREREDDLAAIERAFRDAQRDMRRERELAAVHGRPRVAFNQSQGVKP